MTTAANFLSYTARGRQYLPQTSAVPLVSQRNGTSIRVLRFRCTAPSEKIALTARLRLSFFVAVTMSLCGVQPKVEAQPSRASRPAVSLAPRISELTKSLTCVGCRIVEHPVLNLSDEQFEFAGLMASIVRDSSGNFLVGGRAGTVGVFDRSGKFQRTVGRSGGGPGEFRAVRRIRFGSNDSVLVYDDRLQRMTVFDPKFQVAVRSYRFDEFSDYLQLNNHRALFSGSVSTAENAGLPLHVVDADGLLQRSLGSMDSVLGKMPYVQLKRSFARASDGLIYAAFYDRYRVEVWSADLNHSRTLTRNVDWFGRIPVDYVGDIPNRKPMRTHLSDVAAIPPSNLITLNFGTAAAHFTPDAALRGWTGEVPMKMVPQGAAMNEYINSVIEIVDPTTATVLASARLPGVYALIKQSSAHVDGPLYWTMRAQSDGSEVYHIVRFELARPPVIPTIKRR